MSLNFSQTTAKTYLDYLYISKADQANSCKRLKANLKVTWNHCVYFLKHIKVETPRTLATRLIRQVKRANKHPTWTFSQAQQDLIEAIFKRIHTHLHNAKVSSKKQTKFDEAMRRHQGKDEKPTGTKKDASSSSDSSSGGSDNPDHKPNNGPAPSLPPTQVPSAGVVAEQKIDPDKDPVSDIPSPPPSQPTPPFFMPNAFRAWVDSTHTLLHITKHDTSSDNKNIEAILEKNPIQKVVLPDYDASLKVDLILHCLKKAPRRVIIKCPTLLDAQQYASHLKPKEMIQFYELLDPKLKPEFLVNCLKEDLLLGKNSLYYIFENLNAQDLQAAIEAIFDHCGQSVDTVYDLTTCIERGTHRSTRFRLYNAVFACLGSSNQDQLLSELIMLFNTRKDASENLIAEMRSYKFCLDFSLISASSSKDYLVETLSPANRGQSIMNAISLAEICQAQHCQVIMSALVECAKLDARELVCAFFSTIFEKRFGLIGQVSKEFFAVYQHMPFPQRPTGMFASIVSYAKDEAKLKALVQAIPEDLNASSLKEALVYLTKCDFCPLDKKVIHDVLLSHANLRTRIMFHSMQGPDGPAAAVNLAIAEFKSDRKKYDVAHRLKNDLSRKKQKTSHYFSMRSLIFANQSTCRLFSIFYTSTLVRKSIRSITLCNSAPLNVPRNQRCLEKCFAFI